MPLDDLVNEVYRKIGRNVVLFQVLESYLKYIVANGSISGYASEIKAKQAEHISCVKKKTMGTLVGKYVEHIDPDYEKPPEPEVLTEPHFSINFRLEPDQSFYETKKQDLAELVDERNELVHNLLPEFNKNSEESCRMLEEKLDRQCEKIRSEIGQIEPVARTIKETRKKMADFFNSEEGEKQFYLLYLKSNSIVFLLADITTRTNRTDGWTSMSWAANLIQKEAPEEYSAIKKDYGLKSLMLATGLFDICEEKTENGGSRILYRLNENCEIRDQSAS